MKSRRSEASSENDSSDENSSKELAPLMTSLSAIGSSKSFKESINSKGSMLNKSSKSTKQLMFQDIAGRPVNEASLSSKNGGVAGGGAGGHASVVHSPLLSVSPSPSTTWLARLDESATSAKSHLSSASADDDVEEVPPLTPFKSSEPTAKTDDTRVEMKPPNPFLSKSMKGSFSKSLTALGAVKEDLKLKKAIEMVNANMALGLSGKASRPHSNKPRSAKTMTQSSKEANKPDDNTPTVTLHTSDDGAKDPQLTPFTPSVPTAPTDNAKPPKPFLNKSMRGSFSKSLTMLEVVKEDKSSVVIEVLEKNPRTHSAPQVGTLNESSQEPSNYDEFDDPIAMLNVSSRMNSMTLLHQPSKEAIKMLKSKWKHRKSAECVELLPYYSIDVFSSDIHLSFPGDDVGEVPPLTPFRSSELTAKPGNIHAPVEMKRPPNPFLSKSMRGSFSKSLSMLEVVKEDLMMKKAMDMVNANMALGLSVKMSADSTHGVPSRGMLNLSFKEPSLRTNASQLSTSSRFSSESGSQPNAKASESQKGNKKGIDSSGLTTTGDGVNAALTYLNASINAKQR